MAEEILGGFIHPFDRWLMKRPFISFIMKFEAFYCKERGYDPCFPRFSCEVHNTIIVSCCGWKFRLENVTCFFFNSLLAELFARLLTLTAFDFVSLLRTGGLGGMSAT